MRYLGYVIGSSVVVAAGVLTLFSLGNFEVRRLSQRVNELEQERHDLIQYADRISASRRVAQVEVLREHSDGDKRPVVTLLWQEIGPNGTLGKPVAIEAIGRQVYFEAMVIKFERRLVGEGDPSRGSSLALFRRVFGDQQMPETATEFDRSARPPLTDPRELDPLHDRLWAMFWELVDDPAKASQFGVRVAQCEAPSVRVRPGQIWEVSLDAAGGLDVRLVTMREPPRS